MKSYVGSLILAVLVVLALLTYMVTYTVRSTEMTLVATFGEVDPDSVFDGTDPAQAGLKLKWPWPIQKLVRYDARIFEFDTPHSEVSTGDSQLILLTTYCQWRIRDALAFYADVKTVREAEHRIREALQKEQSNVISGHTMGQLVDTDPARMQLGLIEQEITEGLQATVEENYGVQIVAVGVRALGLPESTSEKVIEAMKEERQTEVRRYSASGTAVADAIRSRARAANTTILNFARLKAENIRTEGYELAAKLYERYDEDPEFAMFLRSLESLERELSERTVFLLEGSQIPAVRFFRDGVEADESD